MYSDALQARSSNFARLGIIMASSGVVSSSSRSRSALESFFTPASVAVIGATEREGSVGRTILENLVHSSYHGQVFAVNPKRSELLGIKGYPSVAALPERSEERRVGKEGKSRWSA